MNLPDFSQIFPLFLVFTRAVGLFSLMPVFSGQMIPRQVRIAISLLLSIAITPLVLSDYQSPTSWLECAIQIAHELCVGLIMGLISKMIFFALEVAGEYVSVSIGLSLSANIDPFTKSRASPANTMLVSLGTILFLVLDCHQWCLLAFAKSFEIVSPNDPLHSQSLFTLIRASDDIFLIALQISSPMLAISFLVNLCFSTLGRAAPSLNVFQLSFPVQIIAGLFLFGLTLGLTAQHIINAFRSMPEKMLEGLF